MALTPEDGTGLPAADSFCSVAEANTYFTARGEAKFNAWDAIDDKDAALRAATDYVQQSYSGRWLGRKLTPTQALDWPRSAVYDSDARSYLPSSVVPQRVKNACFELALRTVAGDLMSDLGRETLSESVDVISITYAQGASRQTTYAAVDAWLKPLLNGGGSMIPVVRA